MYRRRRTANRKVEKIKEEMVQMSEPEPTHRQYLILSITSAIAELASAINVAQMHEDYTDEQLENYMELIADMHLRRSKEE